MLHSHLIAQTRPKAEKENIVLHGNFRITVLTERLFRIEHNRSRQFCDEATQVVWFRDMPSVHFTVSTKGDCLTLQTAAAALTVGADEESIRILADGQEMRLCDIRNMPGTYRTLDDCDGDFCKSYWLTPDQYYTITLDDGVISRDGVSLYDDSASLLLREDGKVHPRDVQERDLYLFVYGTDYREAIRALYRITGSPPMIPRYALGNWWSRFHPYTDREYLHLMEAFAQNDIPLTVATVDMDWHYFRHLDEQKQITASGKNTEDRNCHHKINLGWTGYSWDPDLFPDYKAFLDNLNRRGLKVTLNLHPNQGVRYFEDVYEEMAKATGVDPASEQPIFLDFASDEHINAYFDVLHKPYEKDGVEFWWIDWQQGSTCNIPGLDPLWALNHYHMLDNAVSHKPLILSRYCGVGSHRYPLGFTGDTHMTWRSLDYIPYFTATATNAGYTWWSHDIGGHMHGGKDDELYTRYVQFGVFSPINRLHGCGEQVATKAPMVHMNGSGMIAAEFMRLRHRMIPFLYAASYETTEYGNALIEPMYYAHPGEEDAYRCRNQYMFGGQLLVAPITAPGDSRGMAAKDIWLPEGVWTDIFTGDVYHGGRWVSVVRWLDTLPVLAKAGGFFVLDGRKHTNRIDNPDKLTVMAFSGDGAYTLHEEGEHGFMHTDFRSELCCGKLTVTISARSDLTVVPTRRMTLELRNVHDGQIAVYVDDQPVCCEMDFGEYTTVYLPEMGAGSVCRVEAVSADCARAYRNRRFLYTIERMQGRLRDREDLYDRLCMLEDEVCKHTIETEYMLSENEKTRLLEAFLAAD